MDKYDDKPVMIKTATAGSPAALSAIEAAKADIRATHAAHPELHLESTHEWLKDPAT